MCIVAVLMYTCRKEALEIFSMTIYIDTLQALFLTMYLKFIHLMSAAGKILELISYSHN